MSACCRVHPLKKTNIVFLEACAAALFLAMLVSAPFYLGHEKAQTYNASSQNPKIDSAGQDHPMMSGGRHHLWQLDCTRPCTSCGLGSALQVFWNQLQCGFQTSWVKLRAGNESLC